MLEEGKNLQQLLLGKLDAYMQENGIRAVSITLHKNWLKIYQWLKPKSSNTETDKRQHTVPNMIKV